MFRTKIEIVTGFLSSGKTTLINSLINKTLIKDEKLVILLCEKGNSELDNNIHRYSNIKIKYIMPNEEITEELLFNIYKDECPDRLIIEFNGTKDLNELSDIINTKLIKKLYRVNTIYHITDCKTFNIFLKNMGNILIAPIKYSNIVILNNKEGIDYKELNKTKSNILKINSSCYMLEINNTSCIDDLVKKSNLFYIDMTDRLKVKLKRYRRNTYDR